MEGYGLTETTAGSTLNLTWAQKVGSVGRPLPGATIKIAEDGEILIKGEIIMKGYWQNDDAKLVIGNFCSVAGNVNIYL